MRESGPMLMNKDDYVKGSIELLRPQLRKIFVHFGLIGVTMLAAMIVIDSPMSRGLLLGAAIVFLLFAFLTRQSYIVAIRKAASDPGARMFFIPYHIRFDETTLEIRRENEVRGIYPWSQLHKLELKGNRLTITPALNMFIWADREAFSADDWAAFIACAKAQGSRFTESKA